jgi:hypothetical protein
VITGHSPQAAEGVVPALETVFVLVRKCAPGRERQTWETAVASHDADVVVVDGCWPLPARG